MNNPEIDVIKRFINDAHTSSIIYKYLLDRFMTVESSKDVNYLAASRISIDILNTSWKSMQGLQQAVKSKETGALQIGL